MSRTSQAMRCPADGAALVMSERSGIEIDYCPTCRGVWLDRGELDKIIERNGQAAAPHSRHEQPGPVPGREHGGRGHGYGHDRNHGHGRRRKSFLEDLFD